MLFGEAKTVALELLRGDNTTPTLTPLLWREAIHDVARKCEPDHLVTDDSDNHKVFRAIYKEDLEGVFIRLAEAPTDDNEHLDIDEELSLAVIYSYCSFVSNKSKLEYKELAQQVISTYTSNKII